MVREETSTPVTSPQFASWEEAIEGYALKISRVLSDEELADLTRLWDQDRDHDLFHAVNALNAVRNPDMY